MQLSLAQVQPRQTTATLSRAYQQSQLILADTAAVATSLDGAIAFTNTSRPSLPQANFAAQFHVPTGCSASRVVEQTLSHFSTQGVRCLRVYLTDTLCESGADTDDIQSDSHTGGPAQELSRELVCKGYRHIAEQSLHLLGRFHEPVRPPERSADSLQFIPGRSAYAELSRLWSTAFLPSKIDARHACEHHIDTLDDARVECFLARLRGQPAGVVKVITANQVGVIDDLFVTLSLRRQGIAGQLLAHAVSFCVRSQLQSVVIASQTGSFEHAWLTRRGFTPVARLGHWRLSDDR